MLISKESIEEAKKYIAQTDIDVLKKILIDIGNESKLGKHMSDDKN